MAAKKASPFDPHVGPVLDVADVAALQAVAKGTGTPEQQQRAMRLVIEDFARAYQDTFVPGSNGERDSAFLAGRRKVGTLLISYINAPIKNFRAPDSMPGQHD